MGFRDFVNQKLKEHADAVREENLRHDIYASTYKANYQKAARRDEYLTAKRQAARQAAADVRAKHTGGGSGIWGAIQTVSREFGPAPGRRRLHTRRANRIVYVRETRPVMRSVSRVVRRRKVQRGYNPFTDVPPGW